MSETNSLAAVPEPPEADPVVKSETGSAAAPDNGELPTPEPEPEPKPEPPKAEEKVNGKPWWEDRIAKQSRKIADSERTNDTLRRELEQLRAGAKPQGEQPPATAAPSQADIDRMVEQRATQHRETERQQDAMQEFNAECNKIFEAGSKEFPDFAAVVPTLWQAIDATGTDGSLKPSGISLIEAAIESGKAHEVLHHLGRNPDEAIRIAALPNETKRVAAIVKLAASLEAPKQVSKAPAPIAPVGGGARSDGDDLLNIKDTATFIKKFEERQAARKGGR